MTPLHLDNPGQYGGMKNDARQITRRSPKIVRISSVRFHCIVVG
jgi:hypothetical protein